MTKLSVNINKIATLRNARGENVPDVVKVALDCEKFGADGITVHPRPDERHIRYDDVKVLRPVISTEFNIEGYPSRKFMDLVIENGPDQVTLVPDRAEVLTSSSGWDVIPNFDFLREVVTALKGAGMRVSIFVDTDLRNIEGAAKAGADRVEFYTKPYATAYAVNPEAAVAPYVTASRFAHESGLGVNAGHDLSLVNLAYFHRMLPFLDEVSIGHALISDALYLGLERTIRDYKKCLFPSSLTL